MKLKHEPFYKEAIETLQSESLALFAGAGLSMPAGLVDWKGLLKDIAQELGVDISIQDDLIMLAQNHVDLVGGKGVINQTIVNEFNKKVVLTDNHKILARLNIITFWTTNFDSLIEQSLDAAERIVDVKHTTSQLPQSLPSSNVIVYKMHGDAKNPHETILTWSDFDNYSQNRELFLNKLVVDLIEKTFLFIGISFNDPNVMYVLNKVSQLAGGAQRRHWYFIKKLTINENQTEEVFNESKRKQDEFVESLKQFRLIPIWIDDYSEITSILEEVESKLIEKEIREIAHWDNNFQEYDRALASLLKKYPTNITLLNTCFKYYKTNKHHTYARKILLKHLELEPDNVIKQNQMGAVLHNYFGEYKEAEKYFFRALSLNSNFELAHVNLGHNYFRQSKFHQSKYHYEEALRIKPNYAEAHAGLGRAHLDLHDYENAKKHLDIAITLDSSVSITYYNRGVLHHKYLRNFNLAKEDYEKSLELNPTLEDAHLSYGGLLLERLNEPFKARKHFEKALRINQDNYKPHFYIGLALAKDNLDEYGKIIKFETAVELNPELSFLHNHWGIALYNSSESSWQAAKECFENAIFLDQQDSHALFNLGSVYLFKIKDHQEAAKLYERAITAGLQTYEVYTNLAIIYAMHLDNLTRAKELFQQLIDFLPCQEEAENKKLPSIYYLLALIYIEEDNFENAKINLENALVLDPLFGAALEAMAAVLNNGYSDYINAKRYAEEATRLLPTSKFNWYNYATILHNLGKYETAIEIINKVIELAPNYGNAYWKKGNFYYSLKKFDDAVIAFEQGLAIEPEHLDMHYDLVDILASDLKNFGKALDRMESFLSVDTNIKRAYEQYGNLIYQAGSFMTQRDKDATIHFIEEGLQYAPQSFQGIFGMISDKFYEQDNFQAAILYHTKALEYPPKDESLHADLNELMGIRLYENGNRNPEAINYFYKSIAIFPHPYTLDNLGMTLQDMGFIKKAKRCYKLALKLDPTFQNAQNNLERLKA